MLLKNRTALITGAAQGIGLAIAQIFSQEGATCILTDIDDSKGKKATEQLGLKHYFFFLDVSCEKNWQKVIQETAKASLQLDIVVNNAGITGLDPGFGPQDPEHLSLEDWNRVHSVNSTSVFLGCKYALIAMKNRKKGADAAIVNISSRSGLVGVPNAAAYAATKAAVRNHTKSVALYAQEKGYGIRANSLYPAAILTPIWDSMLGTGKQRQSNQEKISHNIPMERMGNPEDVAHAAAFLASDKAKFITGTELIIDGGILAGVGSSPKKMNENQ